MKSWMTAMLFCLALAAPLAAAQGGCRGIGPGRGQGRNCRMDRCQQGCRQCACKQGMNCRRAAPQTPAPPQAPEKK